MAEIKVSDGAKDKAENREKKEVTGAMEAGVVGAIILSGLAIMWNLPERRIDEQRNSRPEIDTAVYKRWENHYSATFGEFKPNTIYTIEGRVVERINRATYDFYVLKFSSSEGKTGSFRLKALPGAIATIGDTVRASFRTPEFGSDLQERIRFINQGETSGLIRGLTSTQPPSPLLFVVEPVANTRPNVR